MKKKEPKLKQTGIKNSYPRKKSKIIIWSLVTIVLVFLLFLFLQSSFFFCNILLPGICRFYDYEIEVSEANLSVFSSKFTFQNVVIKDLKAKQSISVEEIKGSFWKWKLFSKQYYFRNLYLKNAYVYIDVTKQVANRELKDDLFEGYTFGKNLESIPGNLMTYLSRDYLKERFPDLIVEELGIANLNFDLLYGDVAQPGEIKLENLNFFLPSIAKSSQNQLVALGKFSINEPYSHTIKNGELKLIVTFEVGKEFLLNDLKIKINIDMPEHKERLNFVFDCAKDSNYKYVLNKLEFRTLINEKLTSSIKLSGYYNNNMNFALRLEEGFLSPQVLKFINELLWGKNFGVFEGKISGMLLSNDDEFIFNFFTIITRNPDKDFKKLILRGDIASRLERKDLRLIISSMHFSLTHGGHKLITVDSAEKYVYDLNDIDENISKLKLITTIDRFDMRLIDYFFLFDSNFRFTHGDVSAKITSYVDILQKKADSEIVATLDHLKSTLYSDPFFDFSGRAIVMTYFDLKTLVVRAISKEITLLNNLQEAQFIASGAGEGYVDFGKLLCDFDVRVFDGNVKLFETFAHTAPYYKKFPFLNDLKYQLTSKLVVNDETFDIKNSLFEAVQKNGKTFLTAVISPLELELATDLETNKNPTLVKFFVSDRDAMIMNSYFPATKNLETTLNGEIEFTKAFLQVRLNKCDWEINRDNQLLLKALLKSNVEFFQDLSTTISLNINQLTEELINTLFQTKIFQLSIRGQLDFIFRNEYKNNTVDIAMAIRKLKRYDNIKEPYSGVFTTKAEINNGVYDKIEHTILLQSLGEIIANLELNKVSRKDNEFNYNLSSHKLDVIQLIPLFINASEEELKKKIDNLDNELVKNKNEELNLIYCSQISDKKNLIDFGKYSFNLLCDFKNINYSPHNIINAKGKIKGENNRINFQDFDVAINKNKLKVDCEVESLEKDFKFDVNLSNVGLINLPFVNSFDGTNNSTAKGQIRDFNINFQTLWDGTQNSFFDNLNGECKAKINSLNVPNQMTNSFGGNILFFSFEFVAKILDLIPGRNMKMLYGFKNLITQFNSNRYYELSFGDGDFFIQSSMGVINIKKFFLKGKDIESFDCKGDMRLGSSPYLNIVSTIVVNKVVIPMQIEGTWEKPELNVSKTLANFMENLFSFF